VAAAPLEPPLLMAPVEPPLPAAGAPPVAPPTGSSELHPTKESAAAHKGTSPVMIREYFIVRVSLEERLIAYAARRTG